MKAKFDTSEQQEVNASTTAPVSNKAVVRKRTTATAASRQTSKKTTSKDKSVSCQKVIQTTPFSKMLGLDNFKRK